MNGLVAVAFATLPVLNARAQVYSWVGGNGSWSVGTNWSPPNPPLGGTALATIIHNDLSNRTVTFDFNYPTPIAGLEIDHTLGRLNTLTIGANRLATSGPQRIGINGRARVNQTGGLNDSLGGTHVGIATGGDGTYSISGGSLNTANFDVGISGRGLVLHGGGAINASGALRLGSGGNGFGEYRMSGAATLVAQSEEIGGSFSGIFTQSSGTHTTSALDVAGGAGAFGAATLSGGAWSVNGPVTMGGLGTATFDHSGGTFSTSTFTTLAASAGSSATYTLSGSGVLDTAAFTVARAGAATLTQTGGTHSGLFGMTVGQNSGAVGVVNHSGGSRILTGAVTLGSDAGSSGAYHIGGPATLVTTGLIVAQGGSATFTQTGGHVAVQFGLGMAGDAGSWGRYELSGGTLQTSGTYVGIGQGQAHLLQNGGTLLSSDLVVGSEMNGATYDLNGGHATIDTVQLHRGQMNQTGGALSVLGNVLVGATAGSANYNMSGGSLNVTGNVLVGFEFRRGSLLLNGGSQSVSGSLNIGTAQLNGTSGHGTVGIAFSTLSAGIVNVSANGTLVLNDGTIASGSIFQGGTFMALGNTGRVRSITLLPGSSNTIASALAVSGTLASPSGVPLVGDGTVVLLPGASFTGYGAVTPSIENAGTIAPSGGNLVLNGTGFVNTGTLAVGPGAGLFISSPSLTHTGSISVAAGGILVADAPLTNGAGRHLSLLGGTISTPTLTNLAGGSISGFGQVNGSLVNSGSVTFIAPSQIIGDLMNNAGGRVHVRNDRVIVTGTGTNNGTITVANGTIIFDGGVSATAAATGGLSLQAGGGALAPFVRRQSVALAGAPGSPATVTSRLREFGGSTSNVRALTIADGRWDLSDTALVVDYDGAATPIATIRGYLVSGFAGGAWNGDGISSSAAASTPQRALGFGEAASIFTSFPATFFGQSVDNTSVLVAYTRYGDADLNQSVNLSDFNRLAGNFGSTSAVWSQGDFNYDGNVNLADFNLLAANFGLSAEGARVTPEDWAALAAAVPEPAGVPAVAVLVGASLARRRRRRVPS